MIKLFTLTLLLCLISIVSFAVSPISGTTSVCAGGSRTLSDSTPGGHWSSSNTAVATVGSLTGVVTGVSAGTCTIIYTVGTDIATAIFTVNPAAGPISGGTTVAAGSTMTLTDVVSGGTWSSNTTSVATIGSSTGVVTGISAGTTTIYYATPGGCYTYLVISVTGIAPVQPISGAAIVCVGSSGTLSDATAGGHWSSSNTSIATVGSTTGIATCVSAGTCTITYTAGAGMATITFTVTPAAAPITGGATVVVGSTLSLSDATPGGTWSTSGTSVATIGSLSGVLTGLSPGTVNVYYLLPGGCTAYLIVTVTPTVVLHGINGIPNVCVGSTGTLTDSTAGGHWTSSNISVAAVGSSTGVVTGVSAGTCTITYTVGASYVTATFTVNATAPIAGATTVSAGSTIALSDDVSGGTWLSSDPSVASVGSSTGVVTGVSAGTVSIYYVNPAGCGTYVIVTVTATIPIHSINGVATVCVGFTTVLSDSTTGGHWSSSNTTVATIGSSTGIVTGVSAGTCTITYAIGPGIATITFTVNAAAPISGSTTVSVGSAITLSDSVSGGTWLSSDATVATVGSATGIVAGVSAGTANIYYINPAGCAAHIVVTVTPAAAVPGIRGATVVCIGGTRTLTDSTAGGQWSSSNTSIATIGSSTGIVTGVSPGTSTITYTVGASYATITFTVSLAPGPISGGTSVSVGGTLSLTNAVPGGTWLSSNPSIASVGSSSGIVTGIASGATNIYYMASGGCGSYVIVSVTGGGAALHGIHGITNICPGLTSTLTDSTAGGHWSSSNIAIATVGAFTGVVTGIAPGTTTISYTVGASITTILFTVSPAAGPVMGSSSVTSGTTTTLSDAVPGGSWTTSNSAVATIGSSSGIVMGVSAGSVNIYYITPAGCATYHTMTVIASPGFSLFPNPASDRLYIYWQDQSMGQAVVTLSDMSGHIVYRSPIDFTTSVGQVEIPVSRLETGIYLYDIASGNTHTAGRINVAR